MGAILRQAANPLNSSRCGCKGEVNILSPPSTMWRYISSAFLMKEKPPLLLCKSPPPFLSPPSLRFFMKEITSCLFVFSSSPSISPSWECRIKILALPIQTLPSSSKQKSIPAPLCKNVQRNPVPRVGTLSASLLVYLDLRICAPLKTPRTVVELKH